MSLQKNSPLRNFVVAASITLSTSTALASSTLGAENVSNRQDNTAPENVIEQPGQYFMSSSTAKTYGKHIDFITQHTPGLTVLVLTPNDMGVTLTEDEKNALIDSGSCHPINPIGTTEAGVSAQHKIEIAQQHMLETLRQSAKSEEPIISQKILADTLYNNPVDFTAALGSAVTSSLTGQAASISLNQYLVSDKPINLAIISMPNDMNLTQEIEGYSSISSSYLNGFKSTIEDRKFFTLAHEIGGHAYNEHTGDQLNADYNCATLNEEWITQSNYDESIGDIYATRLYQLAQAEGLVSTANAPKEVEAQRSLSNLYLGINSSQIANTYDIHDHVTTLLFDADDKDFMSEHEISGTGFIATTINRLADAISGYAVFQDFKKNPKAYHKEQSDYFNSLPDDPKSFKDFIDTFAIAGQELRIGSPPVGEFKGVEANPQWHYAAIAYIHKHDLLKQVKEETIESYRNAVDELINDFIEATEAHGQKLKNPDIMNTLETHLPPKHFEFLNFNAFLGLKEEENLEVQTLVPGF